MALAGRGEMAIHQERLSQPTQFSHEISRDRDEAVGCGFKFTRGLSVSLAMLFSCSATTFDSPVDTGVFIENLLTPQ